MTYRRLVDACWIGWAIFIAIKALVSPNKHSCYPGYARASTGWMTEGELPSMSCFQYLPYFGDLMAPFAALPDSVGAGLWAFLGFGLYAASLRAFVREFVPDEHARTTILLIGLIPGAGSIVNHQANVLVVGCWLAAAVAVRRERWWLAAGCLAVPCFKMYPVAMAGVFAVLYPRPLIHRLIVALTGLLLLPFGFHATDAVTYRMETMWRYIADGRHYAIFPYQTAYEAWQRHVGPVEAKMLLPGQAIIGLAIPLVLVLQRRRGRPDGELIVAAIVLTSLWCVTLGPSIEAHTYFIAAPALGWRLAVQLTSPRRSWFAVGLTAFAIAMAGSLLFAISPAVRDPLCDLRIPFFAVGAIFATELVAAIRWRPAIEIESATTLPFGRTPRRRAA